MNLTPFADDVPADPSRFQGRLLPIRLLIPAAIVALLAGCGSSDAKGTATESTVSVAVSVAATTLPPPVETAAAPDTSAAPEAVSIPAGQLLGADLVTASDVTAAMGEAFDGECTNVETQQKCLFRPTDGASPVFELMVDCNSIFDFANPSPRMEEYTDTPKAIDGIGSAARFRTMTTPVPKAELEQERASGPVTMCSVQTTFKSDATVDPATYEAQSTVLAKLVDERLPA